MRFGLRFEFLRSEGIAHNPKEDVFLIQMKNMCIFSKTHAFAIESMRVEDRDIITAKNTNKVEPKNGVQTGECLCRSGAKQ